MKSLSWLLLALVVFFSFTSFTPAKAADQDYVILPGDVLQITVWKEEGLDREVIVLMDGSMTFPLVGTINVKNMSPPAVQDLMRAKLRNIIPDAEVTVAVKTPLGHKVSVLGQVQKPGDVVMTTRMGVMQALSQAGGLTPFADEGDIIVIRQTENGRTSIKFPYDNIANGHDLGKDFDLSPGDVVVVSTAWIL